MQEEYQIFYKKKKNNIYFGYDIKTALLPLRMMYINYYRMINIIIVDNNNHTPQRPYTHMYW